MVINWFDVTIEVLDRVWGVFLNFIPDLIGAAVVFVIGWFAASLTGQVATRVLNLLKVNQLFARGNADEVLAKAGIKVNITSFFGNIVKWTLVLVFLVISTRILGLGEFSVFLEKILNYLPNVVLAALIFVATVILVEIVEKIVVASLQKLSPTHSHLVAVIVKWAIWVFAVLAILRQLLIVPAVLVDTVLEGIVALFVISFGLAFGLGGREIAAEILRDLRAKLRG